MRPFLSIFFAIAISLLFADPLHAAAQCGDYGKEAAAQAQRSDELKCGFGGKDDPRFWNDPNTHARWCRGASTESVNTEKAGRGHSLSKCAMCRNYSNQANAALGESRAFRCGFDGARWSGGDGGPDDGHFSWCMHQREHDNAGSGTMTYNVNLPEFKAWHLDPETAARTAELNECKAKIEQRFSQAERKTCYDYRDSAINAQNFNNKNKCGATMQGRWTGTSNEHFLWCIGLVSTDKGKELIKYEHDVRESAAQFCAKGLKLAADGKPIKPIRDMGRPSRTATIPMEGHPTPPKKQPAGGSDKSTDNAGTNKPAGTSSGGSGAMERLGGGPSGGYDNVRETRAPGTPSKSTTGGAAIITPAATASQPAASSSSGGGTKCFGRSCGGGSPVDSGFYNPAPARPSPVR